MENEKQEQKIFSPEPVKVKVGEEEFGIKPVGFIKKQKIVGEVAFILKDVDEPDKMSLGRVMGLLRSMPDSVVKILKLGSDISDATLEDSQDSDGMWNLLQTILEVNKIADEVGNFTKAFAKGMFGSKAKEKE